jgi:hypothetical protein
MRISVTHNMQGKDHVCTSVLVDGTVVDCIHRRRQPTVGTDAWILRVLDSIDTPRPLAREEAHTLLGGGELVILRQVTLDQADSAIQVALTYVQDELLDCEYAAFLDGAWARIRGEERHDKGTVVYREYFHRGWDAADQMER